MDSFPYIPGVPILLVRFFSSLLSHIPLKSTRSEVRKGAGNYGRQRAKEYSEGKVKQLRRDTEGRRTAVSDLCAHFNRSRMELAKQNAAERRANLNELRRSVQRQCLDVRNDLAGARRGWAGRGS